MIWGDNPPLIEVRLRRNLTVLSKPVSLFGIIAKPGCKTSVSGLCAFYPLQHVAVLLFLGTNWSPLVLRFVHYLHLYVLATVLFVCFLKTSLLLPFFWVSGMSHSYFLRAVDHIEPATLLLLFMSYHDYGRPLHSQIFLLGRKYICSFSYASVKLR